MQAIINLMNDVETLFDSNFKAEREHQQVTSCNLSKCIDFHFENPNKITIEELREIQERNYDKTLQYQRNHIKDGVFWRLVEKENALPIIEGSYFNVLSDTIHFRNCSYNPNSNNNKPNYYYVKDLCYIFTLSRIKIGIMYSFDEKYHPFVLDYNTWNRVTTYIDHSEDNLIQRMFNDMQ